MGLSLAFSKMGLDLQGQGLSSVPLLAKRLLLGPSIPTVSLQLNQRTDRMF
jgi:hypothetical protein